MNIKLVGQLRLWSAQQNRRVQAWYFRELEDVIDAQLPNSLYDVVQDGLETSVEDQLDDQLKFLLMEQLQECYGD